MSQDVISRFASIDLSFVHVEIIRFIDRRLRNSNCIPWAAFSEIGLTEEKAKRRVDFLVVNKLLAREVVLEHRPGKRFLEKGSSYSLSSEANELLQLVCTRNTGNSLAQTPIKASVATHLDRSVDSIAPAARIEDNSQRNSQGAINLPGHLQSLFSSLPINTQIAVKDSIKNQIPVDFSKLNLTAMEQFTIESVIAAVGKSQIVEAPTKIDTKTHKTELAPATVSRDVGQGRGYATDACTVRYDSVETQVGASDLADAKEASLKHGFTIPELSTTCDSEENQVIRHFVEMAVNEAATRPSYSVLRHRLGELATGPLTEIAWACTKGSLADYGSPLKRIRVGLRLLVEGRWSAPKGIPSDFHPLALAA